jgi:threonine synthase
MDIQVSSNFERVLFDAYGRDGAAIRDLMEGLKTHKRFDVAQNALASLQGDFTSGRASEAQTSATLTSELAASTELLCPHSAVGVHVANEKRRTGVPMVTLATAHPAKFPAAVQEATGIHPDLPARMSDLFDRDERYTDIENDLDAIMAHIKEVRRA